jgi:Fe-S-cluster-containing dehydrogenase component
MTQYAIITDLNKCVGCLACSTACKSVNNVPIGNYWNKTLRIGPNPTPGGSGQYPDVEMYFLTLSCQHCEDPECVKVCPTQASHKREDGTVQIDKSKCIGCQFCVMACPYNVRYLNKEERVVEKCTLCEQQIAQGELPQCVAQCGGFARFFGDAEASWDSFSAPRDTSGERKTLAECIEARYVKPFTDADVHHLPDVGNKPSFAYILRDRTWQGGGA